MPDLYIRRVGDGETYASPRDLAETRRMVGHWLPGDLEEIYLDGERTDLEDLEDFEDED